jgi:hypothetical protein
MNVRAIQCSRRPSRCHRLAPMWSSVAIPRRGKDSNTLDLPMADHFVVDNRCQNDLMIGATRFPGISYSTTYRQIPIACSQI